MQGPANTPWEVGLPPPSHRPRGDHTGPHETTGQEQGAHLEAVVASHLHRELVADPLAHFWPLLAIEPAPVLDLAYDPLAFALLGQDPAEPGVVGRTPHDEGPEKDVAREDAGPEEEEDDLGAEQDEVY